MIKPELQLTLKYYMVSNVPRKVIFVEFSSNFKTADVQKEFFLYYSRSVTGLENSVDSAARMCITMS